MSIPIADPLPVAVRAHAPRPKPKKKRRFRSGPRTLPPSDYSLTFDCETTRDRAQRLRFGAFQVRESGELLRSGFFYEPGVLSDPDLHLLGGFAEVHGHELLTREDWVEGVFFRYAADLGGICVGFNLPFDISRVAIDHVQGRGSNRSAFSFQLSADKRRDRVRVQHRSATASRIQFAPRHRRRATDHRGHFLDVKTVARALTGSSHSLASLSRHLETEHLKSSSNEHGGPLTSNYVAYAMNDVQATWECYEQLDRRYDSFGLDTPLTSVMSEAGIGKANLAQMGIQPPAKVQPDFPNELVGQIISSYFGGRAEVRLRKQIAQVAHCDFKSMYPTGCGLQQLWKFVIAESVEYVDATSEVRELIDQLQLEDLTDPERWRELTVLVEVAPDGDFFPTRAQFVGGEQYGLAQSYLSSSTGETFRFTLADCYASKLRTGKTPTVISAIRFKPGPPQQDLQPVAIAGNPDYTVDPYTDDFYVRLIDLRSETKQQAAAAERAGDTALADRLDGEQLSLKITANATSYGIFIELNPHDLDTEKEASAYGLDGREFSARVRRYEQPGRYFHPLLATLITGGARLMLTLAELLAAREGLDWAFCDTDSLALVKPARMNPEEFHHAVDRVREWFRALSPYENETELFELEKTNYRLDGDQVTETREPLYIYAISPKRYVLFNLDSAGRPVIRKGSAHGLGHLLDPYEEKHAPSNISPPAQPLHKLELRRWQYDLWYRILEAALAGTKVSFADLPNFGRPATAQLSVTTPTIAKWFRRHNRGKPYTDKTRPFGFLITPTVRTFDKPLGKGGQPLHLVAPYERDHPELWEKLDYVDIYSGETFNISTTNYGHGLAKVQSYEDHARRYVHHPDPKRLGPDGRPCRRATVGLLSPRHIDAFHIEQLGKEANRLEEVEAGTTHDRDEVYTLYQDQQRDPWQTLALPVLKNMPRSELLSAGVLKASALREVLTGRAHPRKDKRQRLINIAIRFAHRELEQQEITVGTHALAILHTYLQKSRAKERVDRTCPACGALIRMPRATYCSDACRQAAYRQRSQNLEAAPSSRVPGVNSVGPV